MRYLRCPTVYDTGPHLNQHWVNTPRVDWDDSHVMRMWHGFSRTQYRWKNILKNRFRDANQHLVSPLLLSKDICSCILVLSIEFFINSMFSVRARRLYLFGKGYLAVVYNCGPCHHGETRMTVKATRRWPCSLGSWDATRAVEGDLSPLIWYE